MVVDSTLAELDRTTGDEDGPGTDVSFAPGAAIGRYLVLGTLGAGSMGVVLAAFDPQLDRKVAVKLLREDQPSQDAHTRLLREAQALARLGHPNVVAVHDVGEFEQRVYLVMEFIEGQDVRSWQRRRRTWRSVVRLYTQAGHGLAAAHDAGLVHRDFKPANVMIGADGRARVTDFGLARAAPDALIQGPLIEPTPPGRSDREPGADATRARRWLRLRRSTGHRDSSSSSSLTTDALTSELTRAGAIVGTPAYMAPEQFAGLPADARSDQFSFCLAFYEALYGERPFAGNSVAMLLTAIGRGEVRPAPRGSKVPGWLRAALVRGLSNDPEQRWPSMNALLAIIERTPIRRRRWKVTAITATLTVAGGAVGVMQASKPTPAVEICGGANEKLAEVWSSTDRERVDLAFTSTELPYAIDTLDRVERDLDAYAEAWAAMYVDACEATRLRWEQSEATLDLRMRCLERSRTELGALVEVLAGAGQSPEIIERAVAATAELAPISRCADVENIASELPLPDDLKARAQVEGIRRRLVEAIALDRSGQIGEAEAVAEGLLVEAEALGYAPVTAEVEVALGRLVRQRGGSERGRELLETAYFTALGEGHVSIATDAAVELIFVVGQDLADIDRAHDWVRHARALVHAHGDEPLALARIERYRVTLLVQEGRYEEALAAGRDALVVIEALAGPTSDDIAAVHNNIGATLIELGRLAEAEVPLREAVKAIEGQLGAEHPKVAVYLGNLGALLMMTGRADDAIATYLRSIETVERAYGPDHPTLGALHTNLAVAREIQGDHRAALRELVEARRVLEMQLGPDHPRVAAALRAQAEIELELGRVQEAEVAARRTLEVLEASFDAEHPELARTRELLARVLLAQERFEEAEAELERGLAVLEAREPSDPARLARALQTRGELMLARGELMRARVQLQRALDSWAKADPSAERTRGLASARLALARTLVELGRSRAAAELATQALTELEHEHPDARLRPIRRDLEALTKAG